MNLNNIQRHKDLSCDMLSIMTCCHDYYVCNPLRFSVILY